MKGKGYTLIEILIVLTIVGLLFSVGYASYRDFSRRQTLAGVAKTLQGDLRKAQQNAMSGIKPTGNMCNDPNTLSGYSFDIYSNGRYQINALCTGGAIVTNDITLSSDITIASSLDPILFKVLGSGTNIPEGGAVITLTQISTGNTQTVLVGTGGDVK